MICETYEERNVYRILVQKPEGNRSLGRWRRTWEDNIKLGLTKGEYGYGLDPLSFRI
jgi:hypothetical protein